MKKLFPASLILAFLLLSSNFLFGQKPKTALEMNDYLTGVVSALYEKGIAWGKILGEAETTKDFSTLTASRKDLEKTIIQKIIEVEGVSDVGGSQEFRKAILSFLKYEKDLVEKAFVPFEKLPKTATQADIDRLTANLNELAKKEEDELSKIRMTQEEYAKKNGFTIQKEDDADKD